MNTKPSHLVSEGAAPLELVGAFRVVIGVIGNDIHSVLNRIMAIALREQGFAVCNLGVNNKPGAFVAAAQEFDANAIVLSSLNGEAELWCSGFRALCDSAGLDGIKLYAGGNLIVGERDVAAVVAQFRGFGFDRVYYMGGGLDELVRDLQEDLGGDPIAV